MVIFLDVPAEQSMGRVSSRGENEEMLKVTVELDRIKAMNIVKMLHVTGSGALSQFVENAANDSYDRLIFPSLEREMRTTLTDEANERAERFYEEFGKYEAEIERYYDHGLCVFGWRHRIAKGRQRNIGGV